MNLKINVDAALNYNSRPQRVRVSSEAWVAENIYCPRCGEDRIKRLPNNRPVADFTCPVCNNIFELKSKQGKIGSKINDGAYQTMIERIMSNTNPDFFFLTYNKDQQLVKDFIVVSKHFFIPDIIEKRKVLPETARRAGWVGCNILINRIPNSGRIYMVKDHKEMPSSEVIRNLNKTSFLSGTDIQAKGWLLDIMNCVDRIDGSYFELSEVYSFENELAMKHPNNKHVRDKIRQQLQLLRDYGYIEFIGKGKYRKIE